MRVSRILAGLVLAAVGSAAEQATIEVALRHIEEGNLAAARPLLEELVRARPEDAPAHYYLGASC